MAGPLFTACGYILAGIISLYYLIIVFKIPIKRQSYKRVKEQIKLGKYLFLSELKITLFTNTNVLLLGFIAGNTAVGYFSSAEKLARAAGNLYTPFTLALFPYMSTEMDKNKNGAYKSVLKITKAGTLLFVVFLIPVFVFSEDIITLIYGKDMHNSVIIFRISIFIPVHHFLIICFENRYCLTWARISFILMLF